MNEIEALNLKVNLAKTRTENLLKKRYGSNRTLGFLPVDDRRRLYNLFIWEQRYGLGLELMLNILFDHYDGYRDVIKHSVRKERKRKRVVGLPVHARVLMGKNSEAFIKQYVDENYPNQEHTDLRKQAEQEKQVRHHLSREHMLPAPRPMTSYESLEEYMRDYDHKMEKLFGRMQSIRMYLRKSTKNYRTSPWR